jgi:hypothetical protein
MSKQCSGAEPRRPRAVDSGSNALSTQTEAASDPRDCTQLKTASL